MKVLAVNQYTVRADSKTTEQITATVEINGVTRNLPAFCFHDNHITIYGLAIRYRTGTKVWPGEITYWPENGHLNNLRSTQDHRQRFHSLQIVGFWEDQKSNRSSHNSVRVRTK